MRLIPFIEQLASQKSAGILSACALFTSYTLYFFVIYPCAFNSSAQSTAPPAAPRTVLWDNPTNFQSYTVSSLKRPTDTPIPFS